MSEIKAALFEWRDDGVMNPLPRFKALCDRQYVVGEQYALGPVEEVGQGSRGGFFAELRDYWDSLGEDHRFESFDHFRKRALVAAGWAKHSQFVMDTPKDAREMAVGLRRVDEYAVVRVEGSVVDLWIPKSIAHGQIKAAEWKEVKPRALDWAAKMAGTTRQERQELEDAQ